MGWEVLKREITKKDLFFKCEGLSAKASIGHAFVAEVDRVVQALMEFYAGPSLARKKGAKGGDPQAFVKFFDKLNGFVPKCATSVTL